MPSELAHHWTLDPSIDALNHGSFGASPRVVLDAQQAWRDRIEVEPVRFFALEAEAALDEARAALADFVGADPDDLAWLPNATAGISTVLRSLRLSAGDELLTTDHAYNAAKNALEFVAGATGARLVVAAVPFPSRSPGEVIEAILGAATARTRLALLDHITSATALVLPVAELVRALADRGIDTLVDGAHAPGMLDLDLTDLGAAYYTGNCHKWLCAPKGSAFLHVRRDRQAWVHPLAISHGQNSPRTDRSRFRLEFDWTGTFDPTAYLAVPDAIRFLGGLLPGGWPEVRDRCRGLALVGRDRLCAALDTPPPAPDAMIGSMAAVPLAEEASPGGVQGIDLYGDPVHDELLQAHGMQVMVTPWPQRPAGGRWRRLVRISAALYNDEEQFARLATALASVSRRA